MLSGNSGESLRSAEGATRKLKLSGKRTEQNSSHFTVTVLFFGAAFVCGFIFLVYRRKKHGLFTQGRFDDQHLSL